MNLMPLHSKSHYTDLRQEFGEMMVQKWILERMTAMGAAPADVLEQMTTYADCVDVFVSCTGRLVAEQVWLPLEHSCYPHDDARQFIETETLRAIEWLENAETLMGDFAQGVDKAGFDACQRHLHHNLVSAQAWGLDGVASRLQRIELR